MIEVQIGDIKKNVEDASPRWINEQLTRRRRNGEPVCVQVIIDKPQVHMRLTTPDCSRTMGSRTATPREQEMFDLWERHRLNDPDFSGGNLVAFLKRIT
jgi:hypothetical protein